MGAADFRVNVCADSAEAAFALVQSESEPERGTITEKPGFCEFAVPAGVAPMDLVEAVERFYPQARFHGPLSGHRRLIARMSAAADDKWGDAVCVQMKDGSFTFFGWAND